jgi:hypothetical protein
MLKRPCATDPELWFGYLDYLDDDDADSGKTNTAKAQVYAAATAHARRYASAAARLLNSADAPSGPPTKAARGVCGPASHFPAASRASATSCKRQPRQCAVSPTDTSTHANCQKTRPYCGIRSPS